MLAEVGLLTGGEAEQIVAALDDIAGRDRTRRIRLLHPARRHSHPHRGGPHRAARRRRPQAAHRPQPQRSGRHRREALGPRRHRPIDWPAAELQRALLASAERHHDVILPGYTHMQRAQPVLAGHYFLAYVEKYQRDRERLADCRKRVNVLSAGGRGPGWDVAAHRPRQRLPQARLR